MKNWHSPYFKKFTVDLAKLITGYGPKPKDFTAAQKAQVEDLINSEIAFRDALIATPVGTEIYQIFVEFVFKSKRNLLAARPYFRERQATFKDSVSDAVRTRNIPKLQLYNINFQFIKFSMETGKLTPELTALGKAVEFNRKKLIELNLPLAMSRVRIFGNNKPAKHLDYMDLVQTATEGLIAAVDKFVLPYTPVFRSVIIGRATGQLIKDYSDTMVHFYPSDRRKLYRANIARKRSGVTPEQIAEFVNESTDKACRTNPDEIMQLLEGADHISLDCPSDPSNEEDPADIYAASEESRPDVQFESRELHYKLMRAISGLSVFDQKLIKLKGIDI